jgi:hypothetical protein
MQARLAAIANDEHTNGFLVTTLATRIPGIDSTQMVERLDFGDRADEAIGRLPVLDQPPPCDAYGRIRWMAAGSERRLSASIC